MIKASAATESTHISLSPLSIKRKLNGHLPFLWLYYIFGQISFFLRIRCLQEKDRTRNKGVWHRQRCPY